MRHDWLSEEVTQTFWTLINSVLSPRKLSEHRVSNFILMPQYQWSPRFNSVAHSPQANEDVARGSIGPVISARVLPISVLIWVILSNPVITQLHYISYVFLLSGDRVFIAPSTTYNPENSERCPCSTTTKIFRKSFVYAKVSWLNSNQKYLTCLCDST